MFKNFLGSFALASLLYIPPIFSDTLNATNQYISQLKRSVSRLKDSHKETTKRLKNSSEKFIKVLLKADDKNIQKSKEILENLIENYTEIIALTKYAIDENILPKKAKDVIYISLAMQDIIRLRLSPVVWESYKDYDFDDLIEYGKYLEKEKLRFTKYDENSKEYECLFST